MSTKSKLITAMAAWMTIAAMAIAAMGQTVPEWVTPKRECTTDTTLWTYANWTTVENGSTSYYDIDMGERECPYGCMENAAQYGDDCADMPMNNTATMMAVWLIAFGISIWMWKKGGMSMEIPSSILMFMLGLWLAWFTGTPLGLIPAILGIMMILDTVNRTFKS